MGRIFRQIAQASIARLSRGILAPLSVVSRLIQTHQIRMCLNKKIYLNITSLVLRGKGGEKFGAKIDAKDILGRKKILGEKIGGEKFFIRMRVVRNPSVYVKNLAGIEACAILRRTPKIF